MICRIAEFQSLFPHISFHRLSALFYLTVTNLLLHFHSPKDQSSLAMMMIKPVSILLLAFASSRAHAQQYSCFVEDGYGGPGEPADMTLQAAVTKYLSSNWNSADESKYGPVEQWCTSQTTSFDQLFGWSDFNEDISAWNTSSATSMYGMFTETSAFNQDLSGWDVSSVKNMQSMFNGASAFNQDISSWNTASVTTMGWMFKGALEFNQDISHWNISANVFFMNGMFQGASKFRQALCAWKVNFPYDSATDIFKDSNCDFKDTPVSAEGPFCAYSDDCPAPPTNLPTAIPTSAPSKAPTPAPLEAISSWALEFDSLTSDFSKDSTSEITIDYKIGKGRTYQVGVFKKGCSEAEAIPDSIVNSTYSTSSIENDSSRQNLQVDLDVKKDAIAGSDIWDNTNKILELCVRIQLISDTNTSGLVVKELRRDIGITLDLRTDFNTTSTANFDQISLLSNETTVEVGNYIEACTCNNREDFACNTNKLTPNQFLNVCIRSVADNEMIIDKLDSLKMVQNKGTDSEVTLNIVITNDGLVDKSISSMSMLAGRVGVHVASVIPAAFFSYEGDTTAEVSGVVYLKLAGSRRRLAVEIVGLPKAQTNTGSTDNRALQMQTESVVDQQSAFAIEVQLEKNELGVATEENSSSYTVVPGFKLLATALGSAAAIMMW
jgi:surface protein